MQKLAILFLTMLPFIGFGQKKANGTIYKEHPAIDVVRAYTKAVATSDTTKIGSFLTTDFMAYNATESGPYDKGLNKSAFLKRIKRWRDGIDYFSLTDMKGSYPDALEYDDDAQKDVVWVETWDALKGVHKETGVKVNMHLHRSFTVNKDNKITKLYIYDNPTVYNEIRAGYAERKNGTIYNQHENINSLRRMIYSVENNDLDKYYSFFDKSAMFYDINNPENKSVSLEVQKVADKQMLDAFDIVSIDQIGYPDYMHYEMGDKGVAYSWWTIHMVRKSDGEEIAVPIHYQHNFNKEGKITQEVAFYSTVQLESAGTSTTSLPANFFLPVSSTSEAAKKAYFMANELYSNVQFAKGKAQLDKAIAADPNFFMARVAAVYYADDAQVPDLVDKALAVDASNLNKAEKILREHLVKMDKDPEAKIGENMKTLVAAYPKTPQAYQWAMLHAIYTDKDPDAALKYGQKLIVLSPEFAPAHNTLGYIYLEKKDMKKAKAAFEKYIALAPNEANPYDSMAEYYMINKEYAKSAELYDKAAAMGITTAKALADKAREMMTQAGSK